MFFGHVTNLMMLGYGFLLFLTLFYLLLALGFMLYQGILFIFQNLFKKFGIFFILVYFFTFGRLEIALFMVDKKLLLYSLFLINTQSFMIICYKFLIKQKRLLLRFNTYKIFWITSAMLLALLVECPTRFRMPLSHIIMGLQWIDIIIT